MPAFFALCDDGFHFQQLDLSLLDIAQSGDDHLLPDDLFSFSITNTPLSDSWPLLDAQFIANEGYDDGPIPDISSWIGASLVFSPKAYQCLAEHLKDDGEFLPVNVGDETFYIFNVRRWIEEDPDHSRYEYEGDTPVALTQLAFRAAPPNALVFKCRFEGCSLLYTQDRLKTLIEANQLTGVRFSTNLVEPYAAFT